MIVFMLALSPVLGGPLLGEFQGAGFEVVPGSFLGWSSSLEGDRLVLGAPAFQGGEGNGAVWILEFDGLGWDVVAELTGSASLAGAEFGDSVALSGDYLLVGAPKEDGDEVRSGVVYVFEREASGSWTEVERLQASDVQRNAAFGAAVSLSGDLAVIGTPFYKDAGALGAVNVFRRDASGIWTEVADIRLDALGARFGTSVHVDGQHILVGAPRNDTDGKASGSAHLYEMNEAGWIEIATLLPDDAAEDANFGFSVAQDGTRALIGAPRDESELGLTGASYLFEETKQGWRQALKLEPESLSPDDNTRGQVRYGHSVDAAGGLLVVGAPFDRRNGPRSGTVYVYDPIPGVGLFRTRLHAEDPQIEQFFGLSAAVSGHRVIAGAPLDDRDGMLSGAAYVFEPFRNTPAWFQAAKLKPAETVD